MVQLDKSTFCLLLLWSSSSADDSVLKHGPSLDDDNEHFAGESNDTELDAGLDNTDFCEVSLAITLVFPR